MLHVGCFTNCKQTLSKIGKIELVPIEIIIPHSILMLMGDYALKVFIKQKQQKKM